MKSFTSLTHKKTILNISIGVGVGFATLAGSIQAQPLPYNIGDALKETQPGQPHQPPQRAPLPAITEKEEPPLRLDSEETLLINAFVIEGAEFISEADLQAEIASYKGKNLSMADIDAVTGKLTALYQAQGYLLARAYVAKQDATGGTLTIRIVMGRYGNVSIKNDSLVKDALLQKTFASLESGQVVTHAELERAMLLVYDMPGAQMPNITIAPGETFGTSDFEIETGASKRFDGYVLGDNHGSRYTGKNRLSGAFNINSPFGIADKLSLSAMVTDDADLLNGRIAYSFPLSANGLRAEVALAHTTYELGKEYRGLDATGKANTFEASLSYPLIRSRDQNLYLRAGYAHKELRDEIGIVDFVTKKDSDAATLGADYEKWGRLFERDFYSSISAGVSFGRLSFDDPAQKLANQMGADTVGSYSRLNLRIAGNYAIADKLSASLVFSAQKALNDKNLDSTEQMLISGPDGVKAYRESVMGDNGYMFNAELRYALPPISGFNHSVGLFADIGRVYIEDGQYVLDNGTRLSDVGIGYYANYKGFILGAQYARAIGARPEYIDESKNRFLLQLGYVF